MPSNPDELSRTGGEWVVEALRAEGVRHVFGRIVSASCSSC
jgi:thiamine pyrophosphate-dependent acetolactate synthase large subunit-like protein